MFRTLGGYKSRAVELEVNLPGTEDTVINQAVPPGGDSGIALCRVEACDLPKRGRLGCAIFGSGGLRSRIPFYFEIQIQITCLVSVGCFPPQLIAGTLQIPVLHKIRVIQKIATACLATFSCPLVHRNRSCWEAHCSRILSYFYPSCSG